MCFQEVAGWSQRVQVAAGLRRLQQLALPVGARGVVVARVDRALRVCAVVLELGGVWPLRGPAPIQEIPADLRKFMLMAFFSLYS